MSMTPCGAKSLNALNARPLAETALMHGRGQGRGIRKAIRHLRRWISLEVHTISVSPNQMTAALLFLASILAGAIAALAGFGIGSILTPLLALSVGTKEAVIAVSIPHLVATAMRFWMLRHNIDVQVLKNFGISSAAGGLLGALLGSHFSSPILSYILGALLIFAGLTGLTGISRKMRFGRKAAWLGGSVSEMLGGLVGNQGGIRSAALLGFNLESKNICSCDSRPVLLHRSSTEPACRFISLPARILSIDSVCGLP